MSSEWIESAARAGYDNNLYIIRFNDNVNADNIDNIINFMTSEYGLTFENNGFYDLTISVDSFSRVSSRSFDDFANSALNAYSRNKNPRRESCGSFTEKHNKRDPDSRGRGGSVVSVG
jgi:hypothetical protein